MSYSVSNTPISVDDDSSSQHSLHPSYDTERPTSSTFEFVYENGRRYASNRYLIPNDETEEERLDLVHHLWGLFLKGELHRAKLNGANERGPEEPPFRVLDLGTGTGRTLAIVSGSKG
jgi:hypothetical protein